MTEYVIYSSQTGNVLSVGFKINDNRVDQYEYAYYLFRDGIRILTKWYPSKPEEQFILESPGSYYVMAFIRVIGENNILANPCTPLFISPPVSPELKSTPLDTDFYGENFLVNSQVSNENILRCEVSALNSDYNNLDFSFHLIKDASKIDEAVYSPSNSIRFSLNQPGLYYINCFIRKDNKILVKISQFHLYRIGEITPPSNVTPPPLPAQYVPFSAPYIDFCFVKVNSALSKDSIENLKKQTKLSMQQDVWGKSFIYKFADEHIVQQDTILSGIINEGPQLIFGQKDLSLLENLLDQNLDPSLFVGKFMLYEKKQMITFTCDYFGANALFYYYDGENILVANRLNLLLLALKAFRIKTIVNKEYIAANMTFLEGFLTGTNFLTELGIKNLYILPLNRYIQISPLSFETPLKNISYEKTPYAEEQYMALLSKAKEDIVHKIQVLSTSKEFTHHKFSFSGGFDSRLNLAALLNNSDLLKKTKVVTRDVSTANDLEISLAVTNHYNMSYALYKDFQIVLSSLSVNDYVTHYRNFNTGMYHILNTLPGTSATSKIGNRVIHFIGAFGETMRSRYYLSTHTYISLTSTAEQIASEMASRLDMHRISHYGNMDFIKALTAEILSLPGSTDYEKFDNHCLFHYLHYHFNDLISKFRGDGHYFSLFLSPYLFEASRMLTMEERSKNKIMLDMAYVLSPEVLSFPLSSYVSKDSDLTSDKWGNTIFDPQSLPSLELDTSRTKFDEIATENVKYNKGYRPVYNNDILLAQMYQQVMNYYLVLRSKKDIGNYFDNHLYAVIENNKNNLNKLTNIFSKLCGIYDQISSIYEGED